LSFLRKHRTALVGAAAVGLAVVIALGVFMVRMLMTV
jgi:hypothetical protein